MSIAEIVLSGFEKVSPSIDNIYSTTHRKNLSEWTDIQKVTVTGAGAASSSIPGAHLAGMAADIVFLMNRMATCSFGIGAILGYQMGLGNVLEEEDFALVLGLWAGDDDVSMAVHGKSCAVGAMVTTGSVQQFLAKEMVKSSGVLIGKKLGGKAGAKIAGKVAGKFSGKALAGFIPFLGPAVSGGINYYFLNGISNAAIEYNERKTGKK